MNLLWGNAQVVSGLVKFVPLEKMLHRRVIVLLNLKPAKMRDVVSSGMVTTSALPSHSSEVADSWSHEKATRRMFGMQVLCASNATHDQVDPISPPEGAAIGERVSFEGYSGEPEPQLNPKKKVFEKLAPDLTTNAGAALLHANVSHTLPMGCMPSNHPAS